jgi:uncharacterized repeat protein (TIGR01451 family)
MSAGTRRSLTLAWTLLFILSLLMQAGALANPSDALAVHDEGLFELDGNAVNGGAAGEDWDLVYGGTSNATNTQFITDPVDSNNDETFTGGSTKDDINTDQWLWKKIKTSQAKNDITHAFAAAYTDPDNNHIIAYFGLNKWEADGDNFVGFWFFKNLIGRTGAGTPPGSPFSGVHAVGDILVLADYTNGGSLATFNVYKWVGTGGNANAAGTLQTVANGVPCANPGDIACGATNGSNETAPWPFTGRDAGPGDENVFLPGTFFEGGIDLTGLGLDSGCFTSFLAETRSSQSVDATLSDFALGNFSFCVTPEISTQVSDDSIVIGQGSVSDTAHLSGSKGVPAGTVDFFLCGPTGAPADCTSGGADAGAGKTVNGSGDAVSNAMAPTETGFYCFRAEYHPAAGSKYLATSHVTTTNECFEVTPASPSISTSAEETVAAGGSVSDTAHLSGGYNPTGTITFNLYGPNDDTCAGAAVYTTSLPVDNGNGDYGPVSFAPSAAGTYRWVASYSGDANNNGATGACNDEGENDNVDKANPSIATSASESVTIAGDIHDTATLSDGWNPTGTITFNLYGPDDATCDGAAIFTTSLPVSGNGDYGPVSFTPTATGTYRWIASYSGDANNNPAAGSCNDAGENDEVVPASPSIVTSANEAVSVSEAIHDSAVLSGGYNPTGTITFNLYGPDDDTCAGNPAFSTTVAVNGNGAYGPVEFTPALAGVYHWIASYSGDANNDPVSGACGDEGENDAVGAPLIHAVKLVATNADAFGPTSAAEPGDTVNFQITVSNSGAGDAFDVLVSDDINPVLAHSTFVSCSDSCSNTNGVLEWTLPLLAMGDSKVLTFAVQLDAEFPVGVTHLPNVVVVVGPGSNCLEGSGDADCDTDTVVNQPQLTILKDVSGNTGGTAINGLPIAKVGDTLTFTLTYDITSPPANNGVITDPIPAGLEYVAGSATTNAEFDQVSYDSATRTLTWHAAVVSVDGSVSFKVTVLAGAPDLTQPIVNVATIDSDDTEPDSDDASVLVQQVQALTNPPTSTVDSPAGPPSNPGFSLMLLLLALAAFALSLGSMTPVPARARRRTEGRRR